MDNVYFHNSERLIMLLTFLHLIESRSCCRFDIPIYLKKPLNTSLIWFCNSGLLIVSNNGLSYSSIRTTLLNPVFSAANYNAFPPETFITCPVIICACSLARNNKVSAISSGRINFPIGINGITTFPNSSSIHPV